MLPYLLHRPAGHACQPRYSGTLWTSGLAVTGLTRPASNGQSRPRYQLIRDLAIQAAAEDGTDDIYNAVVALYPVA